MSRPVWYLSLRSPYSWLAIRLAQQQWPRLWADSELRVFFEPGVLMRNHDPARASVPYTPMSRAKHLYILRDVRRAAEGLGLRPTWPVERDPQWETPSLPLIAALAEDPDRGRAFAVELTAARWERGESILDRSVVADCAVRAGLDAGIADAADEPRVRDLAADTLEQLDRHGVFGVPMVLVGREPFWGVDRLALAAAAHEAATGPAPAELGAGVREPVAVAEALAVTGGDHAGGCG